MDWINMDFGAPISNKARGNNQELITLCVHKVVSPDGKCREPAV